MTAWSPLWCCVEFSLWVNVITIQKLTLLTTTARQFQDYETTCSCTHPKKSFKKCDGIDFDLENPRINLFSSVYVSMYFCSHTGLLPNLVSKLFCFLCILHIAEFWQDFACWYLKSQKKNVTWNFGHGWKVQKPLWLYKNIPY